MGAPGVVEVDLGDEQRAPKYDVRPHLGSTPHARWSSSAATIGLPAGAGRALAAGTPDTGLVELPGAGHFGFSETRAPFLCAVCEHLARIRCGLLLLNRDAAGQRSSPRRTRPRIAAIRRVASARSVTA